MRCAGGEGGVRGYAPVVEEVEEALELARGYVGEDDRGAVGLACAVDELALEEALEVRRVALQEEAVDSEQRVIDLVDGGVPQA